MASMTLAEKRVLAVDPTHRGFGYVLLEGPDFLVDWGVYSVSGTKNLACARALAQLIDLYRPDVLVLEDSSVKDCRRRARVRRLLDELGALARQRGLQVRNVSRKKVTQTFARQTSLNKNELAQVIVTRFPELTPHLPPQRKPWMSEDARMAIFDAAAFALTLFAALKHRANARDSLLGSE
jgi:hypothetical protein